MIITHATCIWRKRNASVFSIHRYLVNKGYTQDKCFSNQLLKNEGKTATNASGTARQGRGFHTPDTCQIAIKIIISGNLMYFIIDSC